MDTQTEELLKGCKKGDRLAQKQLYMQYKNMLFGVCLRYANNRDEAQDLLQDGFIQIYSDLYQYKPVASLGAWMRKVVVNVCLQHIRRQKDIFFVDIEKHTDKYTAQDDVLSELGEQELVRMIQRLPEGYRAVFNMYVIEGYSHKEIAEMLEITESTSKSQLSRAKMQLQKMIVINVEEKQ